MIKLTFAKRGYSPFLFLLILTVIFGIMTFITQLYVHELSSPLSSLSILKKSISAREEQEVEMDEETHFFNLSIKQDNFQKIESFLRKTNVDYDKCKQLVRNQVELKDLRRVKSSYLNELKQLEIKRKNLMKSISQIQTQMDQLNGQLAKLKQKHSTMQHKILADLIKSENLKHDIKKQMQQTESFKINYDSNVTLLNNIFSVNAGNVCTIDSCFKYNNCDRLSLFIYNPNNSLIILDMFDFAEIRTFFNIVPDLNEACLIVIFLPNLNETGQFKAYFIGLVDFLTKNSNSNFLFVNINQNSISLNEIRNYLFQLNKTNEDFLFNLFNRSFFSSFTNELNYNQNFFIHFSIIFKSKNETLGNYSGIFMRERKYLLIYENTTTVANLLNRVTEKNERVLNFNFEHGFNSISESTFLFIFESDLRRRWSNEANLRLVEALRHSTIPVLVQQDLKLPLDDFIAWDELVIRVPLKKLNNLASILNDFNDEEIENRRIKLKNVYLSYFSTPSKMFLTTLSALRHRVGIEANSVRNFQTNQFKLERKLNENMNQNEKAKNQLNNINLLNEESADNSDLMSYVDNEGEDEDESDAEYLGQANQKPFKLEYSNLNYTQKVYTQWNKLYLPFGVFPSNPFDFNPATQNQKLNDEFVEDLVDLDEYLALTNFTLGGGDGKFFHQLLNGNSREEQFTIVILTFKREQILINLLDKYLKLPYLNQILIVWNSPDTSPSLEFKNKFYLYVSTKRLRILSMLKNSLNNRFLPFDLIETDAVLSLDDDVQLRPDEIMLGFRVWRENRDRIVGFPARYHAWHFKDKKFIYQSYLTCEYSMVLTGAAFYHRFYNYYYSYFMDPRIRDKVDELKNCEDIGFNMLVAHLTRRPPIKVTTKWSFYCSECEGLESDQQSPISLKLDHYSERSECVQYFTQVYGYNPLLYSQYRADSVLFKTRVPADRQKCFKYV